MAPILGYWKIRGLTTPIRLLLEQAGVEYEEKLYECGPPPEFKRDWIDEKHTLGLDFPNLPYYIDGDLKLTQSRTIMRHLARKYNLAGNSEAEVVRAEMLTDQVIDLHMNYALTIAYNKDFEKNKETYLVTQAEALKQLSDFLGDNKFVVGDHVTYADFVLYEYLQGQLYYKPGVLKDYPRLEQFVKRVDELEAVKKYFNSPRAIKFPFQGAPAYVGGQYSDAVAKLSTDNITLWNAKRA